eukprot:40945-Chlamydomonas_euryale.AAC.2
MPMYHLEVPAQPLGPHVVSSALQSYACCWSMFARLTHPDAWARPDAACSVRAQTHSKCI